MRKSRGINPLNGDLRYWPNLGASGIGRVYRNFNGPYNGAAAAFPVDVLRAWPFVFPKRLRLENLQVRVSTLAVAGVFRLNLWSNVADKGTLLPDALLWESGNLPSDAVANIIQAVDYVCEPGRRYWVGHHAGVLAASFIQAEAAANSPAFGFGLSGQAGSYRHGVSVARAFGAAPATFPGGAGWEITLANPCLYSPSAP